MLAQALLDGVTLLASGTTAQPLQTPPSRALRRRKRRQATMRSLYRARSGETSSAQVDLPASPAVASGCVDAPVAAPAPIPSDVALIDDELDACLSDLPFVQLSTYDFTSSALCCSQKKRLEIDFKQLQDELQAGLQRLHDIVSQMRLCESGMDNGSSPLAQPTGVEQVSLPEPAPLVDASLRPFQPINTPLGQPSSGWEPLFQESAPQQSGQDCKQQ
jgi:hypothetical protein